MQCRLGIGILCINNHKTGGGRIREVDKDVVIGQWGNIIEVMADRLQCIASRINIIRRAEVLSVGAKYLLSFESGNALADKDDMIGVCSYQWGVLSLYFYIWYSCKRFGIRIEPGCKDNNETRDDNADSGCYYQTKNACRNNTP